MPDKETFFKQASSIVDFLLLHPVSSAQKYVTLVLALVLIIFLLSLFHRFGGAGRTGFWISLMASGVSMFFLMVAAIWGEQGIAQFKLVAGQHDTGLALLLAVAFFAGVAPWTRFCFKSAYFTSVAAWILTTCFVGGAIYFSLPVWKTVSNAREGMEKAAESTAEKTKAANE